MHWRPLCLLVLGLFPSFAQTTSPHEQFDEELVVKSFQDGRVASTFTFKTLLTDASPRDPRTLALEDDECTSHYLVHAGQRILTLNSPALYSISAHAGSTTPTVRYYRIASYPERWKVEVRLLGLPRSCWGWYWC